MDCFPVCVMIINAEKKQVFMLFNHLVVLYFAECLQDEKVPVISYAAFFLTFLPILTEKPQLKRSFFSDSFPVMKMY